MPGLVVFVDPVQQRREQRGILGLAQKAVLRFIAEVLHQQMACSRAIERLAVGGFQLDKRGGVVDRVQRQASAQGVVIGDDAEGGLVAWLGQVGVGGSAGDVGNSAVVVDLGSGDGGTGVEVTHHASNLGSVTAHFYYQRAFRGAKNCGDGFGKAIPQHYRD